MHILILLLFMTNAASPAQQEPASAAEPTGKQALKAELPKLDTIYATPEPRPLGPETPLSREYYARLMRYVPRTDSLLRDWPGAPGCRYHKLDGHNEMEVRQNADVALGYSVLLAGSYDSSRTGVPQEKIAQDLNALLRYLTITHKANFLPTGDSQPWGDQWQSAFWAAIAGKAAWLAWERLDPDVRLMAARMIEHEANRFNSRQPDSGYRGDTKAEENAWNSEIIALAACMFPHHPNNALWHERAILYMLNSFVREADRQDERIVDGKPAKARLTAVTLWPDYTLENHNRVHPDYMGTIALLLRNALAYRAAGLPLRESMTYNVPEVWAILVKLAATNGSLFYVNGQDWWPHRHDVAMMVAGQMSAVCRDRDAAFIERAALEFTKRMHARFSDGTLWHPNEYNYPNAEEEMICRYAELYLLHRMLGDGPKPTSRSAFLRRHSGIKIFQTGRFLIHRTPAKLFSFAWGNGAMGLLYPSDDTWFTSPSERGMVGRISCEGLKDSTPIVEEHRAVESHGNVAFSARIARCERKVEQAIGVFSMADGPVLYLERLVACEPVGVTEIATGTAPILNEDAPGISPNRRTVAHAGGKMDIPGTGGEARMLVWDTTWANVDGKLGVVSTSGRMAYRDQNAYSRSRLEEELIANYTAAPGQVEGGQQIGACVVAFIPNQSATQTASAKIQWEQVGATLAAKFGHNLVVVNLGNTSAAAGSLGKGLILEPLQAVVLSGSM